MTIPAIWNRVQGDVGDTVTARFEGVLDLVGVTAIEAHVWREGTVATLAAEVADPDARTVLVQLGSWLATATPGTWKLEIEATWPGPVIVTSPAKPGGAAIYVRAEGA